MPYQTSQADGAVAAGDLQGRVARPIAQAQPRAARPQKAGKADSSAFAADYAQFASVEAVDPYTVKITLTKPFTGYQDESPPSGNKITVTVDENESQTTNKRTAGVKGNQSQGNATISDAPLTGANGQDVSVPVGASTNQITIGTFTDGNQNAPQNDYSGSIDWDDGTPPTSANISKDKSTPGKWIVSGSHPYSAPGQHTAKAQVTDVGSPDKPATMQAGVTVFQPPAAAPTGGESASAASTDTGAAGTTPDSAGPAKPFPTLLLLILLLGTLAGAASYALRRRRSA